MNWIIAGLLMFSFSVVLYLFVRKAQLSQVPNALTNLFSFLLGPLVFLGLSISTKTSLSIPLSILIIIALTAFFLSYIGNLSILKGMQHAPNPGYSLIVGKSYVLYTTLVAVFLFGSQISLKKILAIVLIIFFSALLSVGKKIRRGDILWLIFSLVSFFCWGTLSLVSKWLFTQNVPVYTFQFYLSLFVSLIILVEIILKKEKTKITKKHIPLLILIGLSSTFFNLFMMLGIKFAPNPGYINAVNASSISLVTVFSTLLFKDEFSLKKFIGVLGVTLGLILIFL